MDGILNFNKPQNWTSHDAVAHVRRIARQKRVGHAGTLDPLATGVLLICLGQATRVAEYLMAAHKVYLADIRLGVSTDTYDASGQVTDQQPVQVDEAGLQAVVQRFVGEIEQVPPMYSALKHNGQRLYKLARQGVTVERTARSVLITDIKLLAFQRPDARLQVHCSSGVYIRSLAHDIGQALGCGAHMTGLVRQASGVFHVDQAVSPAALEAAAAQGGLEQLLHPLDAALQAMPAVRLEAELTRRVQQGQAVPLPTPPAAACRAYDPDGKLVAILLYRVEKQDWQPNKVFSGT